MAPHKADILLFSSSSFAYSLFVSRAPIDSVSCNVRWINDHKRVISVTRCATGPAKRSSRDIRDPPRSSLSPPYVSSLPRMHADFDTDLQRSISFSIAPRYRFPATLLNSNWNGRKIAKIEMNNYERQRTVAGIIGDYAEQGSS